MKVPTPTASDFAHLSHITVSGEDRKPEGCCRRFLKWEGCLLATSFLGVMVGFGVGFALYYVHVSAEVLVWVGMPGELFMRMLKAAILPLVICTIISGTGGLQPKESGRVGTVCVAYIVITNIIGAVVGLIVGIVVKPGSRGSSVDNSTALDTSHLQTSDLFADLIRNLVPDNLVSACFEKSQTRYKVVPADATLRAGEVDVSTNRSNSSGLVQVASASYQRYVTTSSGTNILGLVVACAAIGMTAAQAGQAARPFLAFFTAAADVIIRLMRKLVLFTPVGVASLIASSIGGTKDVENTFKGLGFFVLAETAGVLVIVLLVLPAIFCVSLRRSPLVFISSLGRPVMAAVGPPNSVIAMPEIITCAESRFGVDSRVSRFATPLAAAINRDGSTMFMVLTCVYMAQMHGATDVVTLILITTLGAVGSLAVPAVASSSLVTVLMIVSSLEIPPANIGIILALEWFSDRIRTGANACSHVLCCLVTWQLCKSHLVTSSKVVEEEETISTDDVVTLKDKDYTGENTMLSKL